MPALLQRPECMGMLNERPAWKTRTNRCVVAHLRACACAFACTCTCEPVLQFAVEEITAILLARFRSTAKWSHVAVSLGGRAESCYKLVFNEVVRLLHDTWFTALMRVNRFQRQQYYDWAAAIHARTGASPRVIGFLDGTFIPVRRPGGHQAHQRQLYSRYYRGHGYKFQSVMLPNGMMASLYGPVAGRFSDSTMLAKSALLDEMAAVCESIDWHVALYSDSAYPRSAHLLRGLKRNMIRTEAQQAYQTAMNSSRTSVEWGFGCVSAQYPWMKTVMQKAKLSPVAVNWQIAALLTNLNACLAGGNVVSDFFGVPPPSIQEYLNIE